MTRDTANAETEVVRQAARLNHPDAYLAALLAPRDRRAPLVALAAYVGEVNRIPLNVHEPGLGLIRLQWWRDIVEAEAGTTTGSPVADALKGIMEAHRLPRDLVCAPLDAAEMMFVNEKDDDAGFARYLEGMGTAPFSLAATILAGSSPQEEDAAFLSNAGQAYAAVKLARDLPIHVAMGRWPVPVGLGNGEAEETHRAGASEFAARDMVKRATGNLIATGTRAMAEARRNLTAISPPARQAALPAALFEPYSKALQRKARDPLREVADIQPFRRVVGLWLAHMRGAI